MKPTQWFTKLFANENGTFKKSGEFYDFAIVLIFMAMHTKMASESVTVTIEKKYPFKIANDQLLM